MKKYLFERKVLVDRQQLKRHTEKFSIGRNFIVVIDIFNIKEMREVGIRLKFANKLDDWQTAILAFHNISQLTSNQRKYFVRCFGV